MANANFTIVLNDAQQEVLTWIVARVNQEQSTNLSVAQFLQLQVPTILKPYELRFEAAMSLAVKQGYESANAATKAEVRTVLGV